MRIRGRLLTTKNGWRPRGLAAVFLISLSNGDNPRFFCYLCKVMAKMIYTMGEVAEMLGENASAIRYWSNYFEKFIKPQRNAKGNRLYHPEDIETLKQIQYLLKNQGLTLEGTRQRLTEDRRTVDKRVKAIGILKGIREELVEVRRAL